MIDHAQAKLFVAALPWSERCPKPLVYLSASERGFHVHLHKAGPKWERIVALVGTSPEGVLGAALEHWVDARCAPGDEHTRLRRAILKLLN